MDYFALAADLARAKAEETRMEHRSNVLAEIENGSELRFYDHGSGCQRVCYAEIVGPKGEARSVHPQTLYRLRKRGLIRLVRSEGAFDYYGLNEGGN